MDPMIGGTYRHASLGEENLFQPPNNNESKANIRHHKERGDGRTRTTGQIPILGMAGFRIAAEAKQFVGHCRRLLLKEKGKRPHEGEDGGGGESELTPLQFRPPAVVYDTMEALSSIFLGKPVNILLLFGPLAFCSHYLEWGSTYVFWFNFLVMLPLASILGDFTEEVALHTNETIGGLVNATFGNAVEVVVAIQALLADEFRIVQSSLLGSIFSNLLLVLGCSFFFGGLKYKEQRFNSTAASASMGLLALSSVAMVLPSPFAKYYNIEDEDVLIISRVAAIFLLFMYMQLLIFQLYTHKDILTEEQRTLQRSISSLDLVREEEEEEEEEASIPMSVALTGMLLTTLLVAVFSAYLVGSIDSFCEVSGISRTFVGIIILPIAGNAVEHITAVTVAMKNKMDLAMGGKVLSLGKPLLRWLPTPHTIFFSRCRFFDSNFLIRRPPVRVGGMGCKQANDTQLSSL